MNNIDLPKTLINLGYTYSDFEIKDDLDGNGQYIETWSHTDPQPTEQELTDAYSILLSNIDINELPNKKKSANQKIDHHAEIIRSKYITLGSGQSLTYQKKSDDAELYINDGYPVDLSNYPWIQAEVNATGKTATQAADDIIATRDAWVTKGLEIEETRMTGKTTIDNATTISEINVALNNTLVLLNGI